MRKSQQPHLIKCSSGKQTNVKVQLKNTNRDSTNILKQVQDLLISIPISHCMGEPLFILSKCDSN